MIERFKKGYFARSKAGHDKDTLYVILDRDDRFVYLSDGRLKEVNNPKKKKEKHLQFIASQATTATARLRVGRSASDSGKNRFFRCANILFI